MLWLIISILALAAGVFMSSWVRTLQNWPSLLHGFVVGFIGFLLLIEVMPVVTTTLGTVGWVWFAVGLLFMYAMERLLPAHQSALSTVLMATAFSVHALLDGAALGINGETFLILAVLTHRLPMGFAIGAYFHADRTKWIVLGGMSLASLLGFYGVQVLPIAELTIVQALASGGVAHVLLHSHIQTDECTSICTSSTQLKYWRIAGLLLGVAAFGAVGILGHDGHHAHVHHLDEAGLEWGGSLLLMLGLSIYMFWDRFHQHHHL